MRTFTEWLSDVSEVSDITVCESSLTRMMSRVNSPWCIITAYRKKNPDGTDRNRDQNIAANRVLRGKLNSMKMGVHQLIGHWRECKDSNIPYPQCPEEMKVDAIERSYFVAKPPEVELEDFERFMLQLSREFNQDGVLLSDGQSVKVAYSSGGEDVIGSSNMALNKVAQAYSQHIMKQNVPFVFEGFEQFHGNVARQGASKSGLTLPPLDENFVTLTAKQLN
jgi:hypothetical protein